MVARSQLAFFRRSAQSIIDYLYNIIFVSGPTLIGNMQGAHPVSENKSKNYTSFPIISNISNCSNYYLFVLTHLTSCAYGIHILTQGDVLLSMVSTPLPSGSEFPVTHCKKRLTIFPSSAGMALSKHSLDWKN
jgi:hypothetical protein